MPPFGNMSMMTKSEGHGFMKNQPRITPAASGVGLCAAFRVAFRVAWTIDDYARAVAPGDSRHQSKACFPDAPKNGM